MSNDSRAALTDLFSALQATFKKYSTTPRKQAWDGLISSKGRDQVNRLLNSPTHQVTGIPGMLKFKEWAQKNF